MDGTTLETVSVPGLGERGRTTALYCEPTSSMRLENTN